MDSLESTISELINSSFDYVIDHKQLPTAPVQAKTKRAGFARFVGECTLDIDWSGETRTDKEIIRSGKVADYESLA